MAPELFRKENASSKSDIYSYGIVLYQCYNLNLDFNGKIFNKVNFPDSPTIPKTEDDLKAIKAKGFIPMKLDTIPDKLWDQIILPCLNNDPEQRPTAEEICQIFEDNIEDLGFDDIDYGQFDEYCSYITSEESKLKIPQSRWHFYRPEHERKLHQ